MKKTYNFIYLILDIVIFIISSILFGLNFLYSTKFAFLLITLSYLCLTSIAGIIMAFIQKQNFKENLKNNIKPLIPMLIMDALLLICAVIFSIEIFRNLQSSGIVLYNLRNCLFLIFIMIGQPLWELEIFRNLEEKISFTKIYTALNPVKILIFVVEWIVLSAL